MSSVTIGNDEQETNDGDNFTDHGESGDAFDCIIPTTDSDRRNWKHNETMMLISLYRDLQSKFQDPKYRVKHVWDLISERLQANGIQVTGMHACNKWKSLMRAYRKVKMPTSLTTARLKSFKYLDEVEAVLTARSSCAQIDEPIKSATMANNCIETESTSQPDLSPPHQVQNSDVTSGSSEDECSETPYKRRKIERQRKMTYQFLQDYLRDRLKQRQKRDEESQRRHKERISLERRKMELLEKLVDNFK